MMEMSIGLEVLGWTSIICLIVFMIVLLIKCCIEIFKM